MSTQKRIDRLVAEIEAGVRRARAGAAAARVAARRLGKQVDEQREKAEMWERRAMRAVEAGDDDLARAALVERDRARETADALDRERAGEEARAQGMDRTARALERKRAEIDARRGELARQIDAGNPGADVEAAADAAFARIEASIEAEEAEVALAADLGGAKDRDVERSARELEAEAALAALKEKMKR